ncbi:hypothetical protein AVEN_170503-1 [Araneus ventricosus]|uniref:DUF5641 domain-containing protein n=1 Tax=Araneus ventricosus TaxID=182803 RepID=A0A4Y2BZR8_ARAVE|nr:hypothetical protein AVEN_170503-1 [Araneus ventricosus]
MLFGRTQRLSCDILFEQPSETPSSPNEYMKNLEARLQSVHAFARERIKLASERMKTRYDSRATDHHFREGDLVLRAGELSAIKNVVTVIISGLPSVDIARYGNAVTVVVVFC